jgi:hypothetical protein
MQKLQLIALFADLNPEQVAHREHADPSIVAVDHRQVPAADLIHAIKRLMRRLVTANHGAQLAGYFAKTQ